MCGVNLLVGVAAVNTLERAEGPRYQRGDELPQSAFPLDRAPLDARVRAEPAAV